MGKFEKFDRFLLELLDRYQTVTDRDGSQAFDSLASLRQYVLLYRVVQQYTPQEAKVLDWGCGSGHFSSYLLLSGYHVSAFGFSEPSLVSNYIRRGQLNFHRGGSQDPVTIPFSSDEFDVVTSVGVLEHVREHGGDESRSLAEIGRLLKPGGIFICYHFPNRLSWIEALARRLANWSHPFLYSGEQVKALFSSTGYEILECRRYGFLPRNIFGKPRFRSFARSRVFADGIDAVDWALSVLFRPFCQNWLVVARKPPRGRNSGTTGLVTRG